MGRKQFADLLVPIKDEDPHLRQRTTPMKVLVLGYPRTGTSCIELSKYSTRPKLTDRVAMQKALEHLGFGPCYHMRTTVNEYPRDCAMWMEAFQAKYDGIGRFGEEQWDQLLGSYSVSPCSAPKASSRIAYIHAGK